MADVEVNWNQYFESIKSVCPWSNSAFRQDKITITTWHSQISELGEKEACVYIAPKHNPRQLKKMCDRFNKQRPDEEWLWSHPRFGYNSTPVPCFIQQHRDILENIRKNTKF